MNVIDTSPIDKPAVGRIVKEDMEIGQLCDCHLYVLPSNTDALVQKASEVLEKLLEHMGTKQLLNSYTVETLDRLPVLEDNPKLNEALLEEKANIILPLNTPCRQDKQYLIVHSEEKNLMMHIPLMLYTSERISRHYIVELMKARFKDNDKDVLEIIRDSLDSDEFWKRYATHSAANSVQPSFGMAVSKAALKGKIGIEGRVTHKDKIGMMNRVEENFTKASKDEVADAELSFIFDCIDTDSIKHFAMHLNKNLRRQLATYMNVQKLAENSEARLEVRKEGRIDSKNRTNGRYRLYIVNGTRTAQVEFSHRNSFIVYLLYLMEKHSSDDVDTLDIGSYRQQFADLLKEVYKMYDGDERFDSLVKTAESRAAGKQARLKECYSDIRISISNACKKVGELASPYIIENADEHLYVLKKNIVMPQELLDMMKQRNK